MKLKLLLLAQFSGLMGQNGVHKGSQKGQNVPISRKNEYYELAICNHTLNHIGKPTVAQM